MRVGIEASRHGRWSFKDHPASVGETYLEHMQVAWGFSGRLALASLACFVHGLVPFTFTRTGSSMVNALYHRMGTYRVR